jgi:hypothetical protein
MKLSSALIGVFFVCGLGIALFQIKYRVLLVEKELNKLTRQIFKTEEGLYLLRAEWSYLNHPARLQALSEKYLWLKPAQQIVLSPVSALILLPLRAQRDFMDLRKANVLR